MGRNRMLVFGLLLLMVLGILITLPSVRKQISQMIQLVQPIQTGGPTLPNRESDKKVCGMCHTDKSRDFNKKFQHAPFVRWYCTDCHAQHTVGTGKHEFVVNVDQLCTTCHFNRLDETTYLYQHKPYQLGHCTDCHDPHSSDYKALLRVSPNDLCTACHKMDLVYNFPFKHKPYEIGACADCHDPHASKYRGMTKLPGKALCFTCHYDRQNELLMPVQHKPYATGDCINCHGAHIGLAEKLKSGYIHTPVKQKCTACHLPHASLKPALLPESRTELCYLCHSNIRPEFQKNSYHPVGNGLLECDGCHDPHVGAGPNLVRKKGNQLCYMCHKGLEATYEKLAHATKADGVGGLGACTNCHVPHGSDWKPLLIDKQEPMCNNCHTKIAKARINHPYGEKYNDTWHGGTMHCTSCHGPHGTENKYFTLITRTEMCLKCHGKRVGTNWDIHRTVEPLNETKPNPIKTDVPPRDSTKTKAVNKKAGT
jgi:predicted CXXCH cytochrome family protein